MKIIEASVNQCGRSFEARVVMLDEGLRYTGEAGKLTAYDSPSAALYSAFSDAARQITDKLKATLSVKTEVTF